MALTRQEKLKRLKERKRRQAAQVPKVTAAQLESYWKANPSAFAASVAASPNVALSAFQSGVQDINETYQTALADIARSGQYDRQSEIRQAGSHLRVDAANQVEGLMQDLGLTQADLHQSVSGSSNDLFMDLGVGNLQLHDIADVNIGTSVGLPNYRDIAAQGGDLETTSDLLGDFTLAERVDPELERQALGMIASLAVAGAVPASGLTGIYGGAASGAGSTLARQAAMGDIDAAEVLKAGGLGALTAAGTDFVKDIVSPAIDPATGVRATTSDFGGAIGEKGWFSGIPEMNIEGLRDFSTDVGDFFFGPATTQEWVQLQDGTKVVPDANGMVDLPSGQKVPMSTLQNNLSSFPEVADTFIQEAGTGGILPKGVQGLLDTFVTPIADDLATAIVGDTPWHDERVTLKERLEAERSRDSISNFIWRELPKTPPKATEEETAASQPITGSGQGTQEVVENTTEEPTPMTLTEYWEQNPEELAKAVSENPEAFGMEGEYSENTQPEGDSGGDTSLTIGDNDLVIGDTDFPLNEEVFGGEDEVGRTQTVPQEEEGTAVGNPTPVPFDGAPSPYDESEDELFRLARILQVQNLPEDLRAVLSQRISTLMGQREKQYATGDITGGVDERATERVRREDIARDNSGRRRRRKDPIQAAIDEVRNA